MGNFYKHAAIWAIFIAYEVSYVSQMGVPLTSIWDYILHYTVNIALFYCNAEGLKLIFRRSARRFLWITLFMVGELILYLVIEYFVYALLHLLNVQIALPDFISRITLVKYIYRGVYFIGFSTAYWFAMSVAQQKKVILELENDRLRKEVQSADLENKLIQAKNAYLQSQLNPHLLFNTLSFIYNTVRKVSDSAASAILLLSEMMRYSLTETTVDGKAPLKNEIDHIKNLIKLNQLRFNEKLKVNFKLTGSCRNEYITPLILLTFIENMYKHGTLTDANFPAQITVSIQDHTLHMTCLNKKNKSHHVQGWGIGIENAKARLNTNYPNRYSLIITEDHVQFQIQLNIQL